MSKNDKLVTLIQYLREALYCEATVFALRQHINDIDNQIHGLKRSKDVPEEPVELELSSGFFIKAVGGIIRMIFIGAICGVILGTIVYFVMLFWSASLHEMRLIIATCTVGGAVLGGFAQVDCYKKQIEGGRSQYQQQLREYHEKLESENTRYNMDIKKHYVLITHKEDIDKLIYSTGLALQKLYSLNILHPQYRNMEAVAYILEYLETGQTYSLSLSEQTGDRGAYNLYAEDKRANRIIDVLNSGFAKLASQLSYIANTQHSLYTAINESNVMYKSMQEELVNVNRSVEQNTAYTKQVANNSRILVDINRDRWGILRNLDGSIVNN